MTHIIAVFFAAIFIRLCAIVFRRLDGWVK